MAINFHLKQNSGNNFKAVIRCDVFEGFSYSGCVLALKNVTGASPQNGSSGINVLHRFYCTRYSKTVPYLA
jgi:hypothetical protein